MPSSQPYLLGLLGLIEAATLPKHTLARQAGNHKWHGGFSPYHGYPGGHGHGTYTDGFGHDQYPPGWNPYPPPHHGNGAYVEVPSSTPGNACPPVSPEFIGFAFEEASFVEYAQSSNGTANQFSINLINAIMSRTGGNPIIRLGGTSADYGHYIPSQQAPALPVASQCSYQDIGGTTIGPNFWKLTHNIPDATYVVQVPMAETNVSETVLWAKTAAEIIGLDRIEAFEPGNEPDLYPTGGLGPPAYQGALTNQTYVGNFTKYVDAVKTAINPPEPFFQAFDTSAHLGDDVLANSYILDVPLCFQLGIDNGNVVKQVASHYYQTNGGEYADLGVGLMNHTAIADRLNLLRGYITYLEQNHPSIPYVISEVGNSLNPTQTYDYQAVLGSALWQVDFQLYAMSIGIGRINWQQIMHAGYDMWLPIDSCGVPRQTFSNFYAMPFVGDFIGKTGGQTRAVQLASGVSNVVAYAAYVDGKPVRLAIVNLNIWDPSDGPRPSTKLQLRLPSGIKEAQVDVLTSPDGAHASAASMTYAGSQWTSASDGTEVKGVNPKGSYILKMKWHGDTTVDVPYSEAVLLHLNTESGG